MLLSFTVQGKLISCEFIAFSALFSKIQYQHVKKLRVTTYVLFDKN